MSQPSSGGGILHKVQARRKDFALKTGHGFGRPLLSVIVPVYNTAEYFEACLTSLLDGWEPWREVIVVDDGSTDGSRAIAERLAAADARLRVISGGHHGPAHARNLGVSKARGRYLAFVDSDDAVPPDALARLVESLEQSGSDLATGPFCEVRRGEPQFAQWIRVLHDTHVTGTSAAETPLVLRNFYPWNKAYRAAFWRSQGLAFREGSMFEDQPLVTEALLGAHGIDIVDAPAVYTWQRREDESSRSQVGFYRKKAVEARAEAIDLTRPVVTAAGRTVLDGWLYTVIEHYLPNYLRAFPKIDEEDIAAALALVRGAVTLEEIASVPRVDAATRALVWVAHEGDRAAVERLLADGFETPARWMRVLVDPVGPLRPSLEGSAAGRAALEAVAAARAQWLDFDPARFTPRTVETEWLDGDGVAVRGDLPLAGMFGVDAIAAGAVNLTGTFEDPWSGAALATATATGWAGLGPDTAPESGDEAAGGTGADDDEAADQDVEADLRLPRVGRGELPCFELRFPGPAVESVVREALRRGADNSGRIWCPLAYRMTVTLPGGAAAGTAGSESRTLTLHSSRRVRGTRCGTRISHVIAGAKTHLTWVDDHWPKLMIARPQAD